MRGYAASPAIATGGKVSSYGELLAQYQVWLERLTQRGIMDGRVVTIEGEYTTAAIAVLLAAASLRNIVVPLSSDSRTQQDRFRTLARAQWRVKCFEDSDILEMEAVDACHPLYDNLRATGHPGLVLFTSGSTGQSKAAVHDLSLLLEKFQPARQQLHTIVFLQLDHIGGINTLLYTLANGGAVVVPADRSPAAVCAAIEQHSVELLPTSPTFLNLLLLSEEHKRHDLSALRLITYGTEPMPPSTLQRLHKEFPNIKLQQTYGLTEVGILRSKSRDSESLWVRVGGEGYETKVVDGKLAIRAQTAMLGYLNAPSPFDEEGFLHTGDRVEVDGEWLRILGRESEIINVGGNKVYPAEVESVLLEMEGVSDVIARGEPHPITGQVVIVTVQLGRPELPRDFRVRMRQHCQSRLPQFAQPVRVIFTDDQVYNSRFKRMRRTASDAPTDEPQRDTQTQDSRL
jgi:acyl-coenzyme A synthetase/AMP-(fatty) acid ligase